MIKYFIQKAIGKRSYRKPRISVCVPSGVTEVEKRAVEDATYAAGAREVAIIEEPIAAAIGAGIDIGRPCGNMIVDIGGGTADIAVISLGGSVVSTSIKIAGDDFDEAIVRYMRKKHNLLIGERTAEDIKIKIGTCYPLAQPGDHGCARTKSGNRSAEDDSGLLGGDGGSSSGSDTAIVEAILRSGEDTACAGCGGGRPGHCSDRGGALRGRFWRS